MLLMLSMTACGVFSGVQGFEICTIDPPHSGSVSTIRVAPDGRLFVHSGTALYRYENVGAEGECALEGEKIWVGDDLDGITDFDLDGDGRPYALLHLGTSVRLDEDGAIDAECDFHSGHSITVDDAGENVWVVAVGEQTLAGASIDDCAPHDVLTTEHGMSTHPVWTPDGIAVDAHDAGGNLPPGWLVSTDDGSFTLELGHGYGPDEYELFAMSDLVPGDGGYWVAGSPDGDLWFLDEDGSIATHDILDDVLQRDPDDLMTGLLSIARSPTGVDYIAAGHTGEDGIWMTELE